MEIETFSCMRNPSKGDIETFSCIRNQTDLEKLSYIRSPPETFSLPCVPVRSDKSPSNPPQSSPRYSTSNMVVDLQSQNPCVVTADPSVQSSPHDYKLLPQEVSPRTASHDYKLLQQEISPQSASHDYNKLLLPDVSPRSMSHDSYKPRPQDISPRSTSGESNKLQQNEQFSPKGSHEYEHNHNLSQRTSSHDYRLLPPEGVMTPPSPDNPPSIDHSDIPPKESLSFKGMNTPKNSPPQLSPKQLDMDHARFDCGPKQMDFDSADQNSGSDQSPCQTPEKHRSRRKQTIEDIVRRMKGTENGYYSDSEEEEDEDGEDTLNGSISMDMHNGDPKLGERINCGQDEVDGAPMQISGLKASDHERQPSISNGSLSNGTMSGLDGMSYKNGSISLDTENIQPDRMQHMENGKGGKEGCENKDMSPERQQINAIMDKVAEITGGGKSQDFQTPKQNGNWFHGAFNSLPLFPFPPSPLEHHLNPNFLPMFDGKFPSSQEVEKDYLKCQFCERTFRRQKNLENHIENTHHGKCNTRRKSSDGNTDMYFKCTHCPYTTKHQSNLYVHLRIHTGERPYICGACGVQYSQSHSLKSHIINKHDGIMSYYIKEKRNRSPRGLGYLTQVIPDMYKISPQPTMVPHSLHSSHHGNQQQQQQQQSLLMPQHNIPMPPHPHVMTSLHPQVMTSPNHQGQGQPPMTSPMQKMMISPQQQQHQQQQKQQQQQLGNHPQQENRPTHLGGDVMPRTPQSHPQNMQQKSSPNYYANGFPSPNFANNNFLPQYKVHQPAPVEEQPLPLVTNTAKPQQMPLQEIRNNQMEESGVSNHGAIDLTKKATSSHNLRENAHLEALKALEMSGLGERPDKDHKCTEKGMGECANCVHASKLRTLRLNVVRMLSILVPNLNFEEKGISADGDSVDELLHDVIESNMQEEEMSE